MCWKSAEAMESTWQAFRDDPEWVETRKRTEANGPIVSRTCTPLSAAASRGPNAGGGGGETKATAASASKCAPSSMVAISRCTSRSTTWRKPDPPGDVERNFCSRGYIHVGKAAAEGGGDPPLVVGA